MKKEERTGVGGGRLNVAPSAKRAPCPRTTPQRSHMNRLLKKYTLFRFGKVTPNTIGSLVGLPMSLGRKAETKLAQPDTLTRKMFWPPTGWPMETDNTMLRCRRCSTGCAVGAVRAIS